MLPNRKIIKYLYLILVFIFVFSCNEKHQSLSKLQKGEIIRLAFYPSFHDDLLIEFEIFSEDSIKMTLIQNANVSVFDSIEFLGENSYQSISYGDFSHVKPYIKPNFIIEYMLSAEEFKLYQINLEKIEDILKKQGKIENMFGLDGMTINYLSIRNSDTLYGTFWSPSIFSEEGQAFTNILEILEQNPNRIVEKTCEKIKQYFDQITYTYKIISEDPLLLKVYDTPCCPCQSKISEIVKKLPEADQIYVDITHYGFYKRENEDLSCWEEGLKKKFKKVRWIMNYDELQRFRGLIYNE